MNSFIVIPTYNERENIERLVDYLINHYPDFHLVIVDDNSPDGTGQMADKLADLYPQVNVIHRPQKMGLGRAYVEGFKYSLAQGADLIFEMDADYSHDPDYIKDFLAASECADLVIGSRYYNGVRVEGWRFRRLLLSKLANIFVSYILVRPVWDFTAGYRCYKKEVLKSIDLNKIKSDGYAFQIEMTYLTYMHGFRVREIPILFKERQRGTSKIGHDIIWEAFWMTLRCHAPVGQVLQHLSFLFKNYNEFTCLPPEDPSSPPQKEDCPPILKTKK
jgi:dolichol-phosphate mannosyltransferase